MWICEQCETHNENFRKNCLICGAARNKISNKYDEYLDIFEEPIINNSVKFEWETSTEKTVDTTYKEDVKKSDKIIHKKDSYKISKKSEKTLKKDESGSDRKRLILMLILIVLNIVIFSLILALIYSTGIDIIGVLLI